MPNVNTPIFKNVQLATTFANPSDFQVVTMLNTNLGSNTFTAANGALRSPNWPGVWPSPSSLTTSTVFPGIPGVYRVITGSVRTAGSTSNICFTDGSGVSGACLMQTFSSSTDQATPIVFVSGVNQTFTVTARGSSATTAAGWSLDVRSYRAVSLTPGQITAEGGVLRAADATGTFTLRRATKSAADVQVFTSNGTWTKPGGVKTVRVYLIGGGGGGGSGRRGATSTTRGGGGGGGAGAVVSFATIPASVFAAQEPVTVGSGGFGGSSVSINTTNGNSGSAGGASTFSSSTTQLVAAGGGGGGGGTTTGGVAGTNGTGDVASTSSSGAGGSTGAAQSPNGGNFNAGVNGGGGGGITSTNLAGTGGSSNVSTLNRGSFTNSGTTSTIPTAGFAALTPSGRGGVAAYPNRPRGGGGGGGGVCRTDFSWSGDGGIGGWYGGGGGGGAASLNSSASGGAGGRGGPGIVIVVSW